MFQAQIICYYQAVFVNRDYDRRSCRLIDNTISTCLSNSQCDRGIPGRFLHDILAETKLQLGYAQFHGPATI